MSKRRGRIKKGRNEPKFPAQCLLESGTLASMRAVKQVTAEHLKYQWNYYSEVALQRHAIQDQIQQALMQTCISYEPINWQRAVKYKYGLHPFSTVGSLSDIGGRFNTGRNVNQEVPVFSGLYLARDKDTALQEHLGQEATKPGSELDAREIALTSPSSEVIFSISGKLDKVFDLTNHHNLLPFIELTKNFKISKELMAFAKKLGMAKPEIIKSTTLLLKTLLDPEWRSLPSNFDVPSNSQIFGHLIYSAGIEGILYLSKFTATPCIVVFPRNFIGTDSFIMLNDEAPHPKVPTKIDASNWRISELDTIEGLI